MKKIIAFSLILISLSVAASAQRTSGDRIRRHNIINGFNNGRISQPERFRLERDHFRYQRTERQARRDGFVGPFERRRLLKMKQQERRDRFRFRHNGRRRVI